jgi:hypothetical protein
MTRTLYIITGYDTFDGINAYPVAALSDMDDAMSYVTQLNATTNSRSAYFLSSVVIDDMSFVKELLEEYGEVAE